MKRQTRQEHEKRIEDAVRYIVEHLDETIDLRHLSDYVCLSRFHFHRVFQALVGETVCELARRLRLERAFLQLRTTRIAITQLALEAGYATPEAFLRAFRTAFGYTPSQARRRLRYEGQLPTPNGVHYGDRLQIRFIELPGVITMQVEIRELLPRKAVCLDHVGPYFMIGRAFGELGEWLRENNIPMSSTLGIYYDDPEVTPVDELRSSAGAFVPDDFVSSDPRFTVVTVAGGKYAVATYIGAYDGLPNAWSDLIGKWLPSSGYAFGTAPGLEIYLDSCCEVSPAELRTKLCIPVS